MWGNSSKSWLSIGMVSLGKPTRYASNLTDAGQRNLSQPQARSQGARSQVISRRDCPTDNQDQQVLDPQQFETEEGGCAPISESDQATLQPPTPPTPLRWPSVMVAHWINIQAQDIFVEISQTTQHSYSDFIAEHESTRRQTYELFSSYNAVQHMQASIRKTIRNIRG